MMCVTVFDDQMMLLFLIHLKLWLRLRTSHVIHLQYRKAFIAVPQTELR